MTTNSHLCSSQWLAASSSEEYLG
ncbi:hypothetical protein M0804_014401 [Polistes exclamans]|nr:hypothetical protein M0804_014402 [Polistes exclamans]KAI4475286.1 hypothetical protein M0804_014401 [Polistes exclamans]